MQERRSPFCSGPQLREGQGGEALFPILRSSFTPPRPFKIYLPHHGMFSSSGADFVTAHFALSPLKEQLKMKLC